MMKQPAKPPVSQRADVPPSHVRGINTLASGGTSASVCDAMTPDNEAALQRAPACHELHVSQNGFSLHSRCAIPCMINPHRYSNLSL